MNYSPLHRLGLYRQALYTIQIEGRLLPQWSANFGSLEVKEPDNETGVVVTTITKVCMDQAELYATLTQIRDLGLPLISVMCREVKGDFTPEDHPSG